MKHFRIFNTIGEYNRASIQAPSVSYIKRDNIFKYDPYVDMAIGDYLLSDLKTKVKRADLTASQKSDVVGIFIGKNPINGKDVFVNVAELNGNTYKFNATSKLDASKFNIWTPSTWEDTHDKWGNTAAKYNNDLIEGKPGYITGSFSIKTEDPDLDNLIVCTNDFAGKQNTIEWYKQAVAGGIDVSTQMPALQEILNLNNVSSLDDTFDGWFLGSIGHAYLLGGYNSDYDYNDRNAKLINESYNNLTGEDLPGTDYWTSSFCCQSQGDSDLYFLHLDSGGCRANDDSVDIGDRLFAVIER